MTQFAKRSATTMFIVGGLAIVFGIIALFSGIAVSGTVEADQVFSTVGKLSRFMVVALVVGTVLGLSAAYFGGRIDTVIMRLVDLMLGFPTLLVALMDARTPRHPQEQ